MKKPSMRFSMTLIAAAALIATSATSAIAETAEEELQRVQAKVSEMFAAIEPQYVQPGPIDGWYTIAKGAVVAYVSADGRYLMRGDITDLDSGINLTEMARNTARVEMMAAIPDEQLIIFSPDEVKYSVSVFTATSILALSGAGDLIVNTDDFIVDTSTSNVGIGSIKPGARLDVAGAIRTNNQFMSLIAQGTAPLTVISVLPSLG